MDYYEIVSLSKLFEILVNMPKYVIEEYVLNDERRIALEIIEKTIEQDGRIIIIGENGCGKTALLALVLAKMIQNGKKLVN